MYIDCITIIWCKIVVKYGLKRMEEMKLARDRGKGKDWNEGKIVMQESSGYDRVRNVGKERLEGSEKFRKRVWKAPGVICRTEREK